MKNNLLLILIFTLFSCSNDNQRIHNTFGVYCEMVSNTSKPIAFSQPLDPSEVDLYWNQFLANARAYNVKIHREDSLPVSALYPEEATAGKSVIIIYNDDRLNQYEQWRKDAQKAAKNDLSIARRLGRLLGYSNVGINKLIGNNTDFKSLSQFSIKNQTTHFYYRSPSKARDFYGKKLGLTEVTQGLFKIGEDAFLKIDTLNEDHPADQEKSTALAMLTDQLAEWYAYCQNEGIPIKYTYKPREGGPHDGFVAIDPEGYLLEFEQFKQHPENELFFAILEKSPRVRTKIGDLDFYASITWTYHKDLLALQNHYENTFGYQLVADQGWTKIYQTSKFGFIGLVDERRGMNDYTDEKAVEVEWSIQNFDDCSRYASQNWQLRSNDPLKILGPEKYIFILSPAP